MKENYCQPGTPVQFVEPKSYMDYNEKTEPKLDLRQKWITNPAVINFVDGSRVEVRVFPVDGTDSYVIKSVRHEDFKKESEPFWRYIPESHP